MDKDEKNGRNRGEFSSPSLTIHRSRKEKLVVRSFSTEADEVPHVIPNLQLQQSFGEDEKLGMRTIRRTSSAPLPGFHKVENDVIEAPPSTQPHVLVENTIKSPKKYRKRQMSYPSTSLVEIVGGIKKKVKIPTSTSLELVSPVMKRPYTKRKLDLYPEKLQSKYLKKISSTRRKDSSLSKFRIATNVTGNTIIDRSVLKKVASRTLTQKLPIAEMSAQNVVQIPKKLIKYRVKEKFKQFGKLTEKYVPTNVEPVQDNCQRDKQIAEAVLPSSDPPQPPPPPPLHRHPEPGQVKSFSPAFDPALEYQKGFLALHKLMGGMNLDTQNGDTISFTMVDLCAAAINKLSKLLKKQKKLFGELDPGDDESTDTISSDDRDADINTDSEIEPCPAAQGIIQRKCDKSLAEIQEMESHAKLFESSISQKIDNRRSTLTKEELEMFKVLIDEDSEFECFEEEQEAADLYCEIILSELKAEKRKLDRLAKKGKENLVKELKPRRRKKMENHSKKLESKEVYKFEKHASDKIFPLHIPPSLDGALVDVADIVKRDTKSYASSDDYSKRVEENMRRLEAGETDSMVEAPCSSTTEDSKVSTVRCRTNLDSFNKSSTSVVPEMFFNSGDTTLTTTSFSSSSNAARSPVALNFWSPPGRSSLSPSLPSTSSLYFQSIYSNSPSFGIEGGIPSASTSTATHFKSSAKNRYSRHAHTNLCPPYDNNHCSYNNHHCSYQRAPNSRFCIQHVDEGATVNFERCKYVKGSRECGLYIPKSTSQTLFCDHHALVIANARIKKSKRIKPLDKTEGLLKHLRCNLDRAEGKIMEPDDIGRYSVRKDLLEDEKETLNNGSDSSGAESDDDLCSFEAQRGDDNSDVDDCDWGGVGVSKSTFGNNNEPDYSCLKNAGHYTVEECVKLHRASLARLKQLLHQQLELLKRRYLVGYKRYCRQMRVLRSQRVSFTTDPKYLSTTNTDMTSDQIQSQVKTYHDTKAAMNHRRNRGPRSLLRMELLKKRQEYFESRSKSCNPNFGLPLHPSETQEEIKLRLMRQKRGKPLICIYGGHESDSKERCTLTVLPLSKFCFKHIIHDKNQKLYVPCNFYRGPDPEDVCLTPVLSELGKLGCSIHALPLPVKDAPDGLDKTPKIETVIDKVIDDAVVPEECEQEEVLEENMVREMEDLVGDEVVDMDHYHEIVASIYKKGIYATDSEESEDTDEDEDDVASIPSPGPPSVISEEDLTKI